MESSTESINSAVMRKDPAELMPLIWPLLAVVTAITVLIAVIFWIRGWLRESDGPAADGHLLLAEYREMVRRGELSEEEFRLIKGRLAPRITGTPAPPAPAEGDSSKES